MNCKGVQPLLSAYLDRELSGDEMLDIRAHLSECRECQFEADNLRSLKRLLMGMEAPEPPIDFESRLVASVMHPRDEPARPRRVFASALVFAGVAACSMFVTLFVISNAQRPIQTVQLHDRTIPFEIQRDQAFSGSDDPLGGAPLITAAAYGTR